MYYSSNGERTYNIAVKADTSLLLSQMADFLNKSNTKDTYLINQTYLISDIK